ncbi:MAG: redoxin domain-containing protein [Bacteroidia bacterium]|nr:redoxin domain-containing protein [Bacteroidia bacterium]
MPLLLLIILSLFNRISPETLNEVKIYDLEGKAYSINPASHKKGTVILFLSPECPLCESYSLTIRNLASTYQKVGISFYAIIPGKTYSKKEILAYKYKYKLNELLFYTDPNFELAKFAQVSITPEVAVFVPSGQKVYQGRIDNWAYELSKKRKVITEHDLANVLEKLYLNQMVKPYKTRAVGCYIN